MGSVQIQKNFLYGETADKWSKLKELVDNVSLSGDKIRVAWKIGSKQKFTVRDFYLQLKGNDLVGYRFIWKLIIPQKIKVFLWLGSCLDIAYLPKVT